MSLKNRLSRWAGPTRKKALVQGFSLVELAIATAIATVIIVSGMAYYKQQLQIDTARALAEQYKTVNNAVGTYMVNYWPDLVVLKQECGETTWLVGTATIPIDKNIIDCSKTLGGTVIANALQPTIVDLVNLGYLQQGQAGPLLQPDDTKVFRPDGALAPHTFGVSIEVLCTNTAAPTTTLALCPDVTMRRDLRSVVFNTRPYANIDNRLFSILGEALSALPNDAGMSIPLGANAVPLNLVGRAKPGAVDTMVNNNFVDIFNPVRQSLDRPIQPSGPRAGVPGILGVRGGYGSSGFQRFTRRDGSAPPTAPWKFNNQDLSDVQTLTATTVDGQTVKGINIDGKNITGTNITGTNITGTNINGETVYGTTVEGQNINGGNIRAVSAMKLKDTTNGADCDPTIESISASAASKSFLYCDGVVGNAKWVLPVSKGIDPDKFSRFFVELLPGENNTSKTICYETPTSEVCDPGFPNATIHGMPSIERIESDDAVIVDKYCATSSGFVSGYACTATEKTQFKVAPRVDYSLYIDNGFWKAKSTNNTNKKQKVYFYFYDIRK